MTLSKETYLALPRDPGSIDFTSEPDPFIETEIATSKIRIAPRGNSYCTWALAILTSVFVIVIIVESLLLVRIHTFALKESLLSPHGLSRARNLERQIFLPNRYTSTNITEASLEWSKVLPGHGFVALEPEYAAQHNLPPTMNVPGDEGKLLYILDSYHAMHCIRILRNHYLALRGGTEWNWSFPHDMHCFDALRQYVMCNPDDTLLYTTGHRDVGHGQTKNCQDWDVLRDWAEARSARYFDNYDYTPDSTGMDLWNNYHYGDGLPEGSLL